jgi:hypothetical protein
MSYATLMVYIDPDRMLEDQVRPAAHLVNKFSAALIESSALDIGDRWVGGVLLADTSPTDLKEARAKLADKGNWFRNIAGAVHRNVEWRPMPDVPIVALG